MKPRPPLSGPGNYAGKSASLLQAHTQVLRAELQERQPQRIAAATGAEFTPGQDGQGEFHLHLWEREILVSYPEFVAREAETGGELGTAVQALVLYHFLTSSGAAGTGRWISFSELPDGRFYTQAFQGYTGRELLAHFGDEMERFETAALAAGGVPLPLGERAFAFRMFPRVALAIVYWRGDEDFPSTYQVLFDASTADHLPTDACAIAGSMLVRRVMAAG